MELKVIIDDEIYTLNVPGEIVGQATEFFDKMDQDMDRGWQMGRDWVPSPDRVQRLQIVGNKLLTALEREDHNLGRMMAAYILSRAPDVDHLDLDTTGEMQNTEVAFKGGGTDAPSFSSATDNRPEMPDTQARAEAERQVSTVYKVGRQYGFSVMNPATGDWRTVTVGGDQTEAERHRNSMLLERYQTLTTRH